MIVLMKLESLFIIYLMKKLFENTTNYYSPWWNQTEEIILVALFDKDNILIMKLEIFSFDYIVVPPYTTVKLVKLLS